MMASFSFSPNIFKLPPMEREFLDDDEEGDVNELKYRFALTPSPKTPIEKDPAFFESDFFPTFPSHHAYFRQYKFEYSGPEEFYQSFKLLIFKKGVEIEAIESTGVVKVVSSEPLYAISDMNNILRETLVVRPTKEGIKKIQENWQFVLKDQFEVEIKREHSYTPIHSGGTLFIDFTVNFALVFGTFLNEFIPHNRGLIKFEVNKEQHKFKQIITFSFCPIFGWTEGNLLARAAGDVYNRKIAEKIRQFLDFYFSTIFNYILEKSKI